MDINDGIEIEMLVFGMISWLMMDGNWYNRDNVRCCSWSITITKGLILNIAVAGGRW